MAPNITYIYCENQSGRPGNGLYYTNGELRVNAQNSGRLVTICTHLDSEVSTGLVDLSTKGLKASEQFWIWFGAEAFINVGSNKWAFNSPKSDNVAYPFVAGGDNCIRIIMGGSIDFVKLDIVVFNLQTGQLDPPNGLGMDSLFVTAVKAWRKTHP